MSSNGKTTCKEVCSNCKCTVVEKPIKKEEKKKENNCVATIVGVLQLPENFCCPLQPKQEVKEEKKEDACGEAQSECVDVYRDLGECLQKCIVQSSQSKQKNGVSECDIGTCGSNGSSKSSKSKNGNGC